MCHARQRHRTFSPASGALENYTAMRGLVMDDLIGKQIEIAEKGFSTHKVSGGCGKLVLETGSASIHLYNGICILEQARLKRACLARGNVAKICYCRV
jgi:hypothetical protein